MVIEPAKLQDMQDIMDFVAAPDCRGRGIGRALIEAVKGWAKGRNAEFMLAQNKEAIRLYERMGFKDSRKIMQLDM